jgi:tripeptide aminopeptidase
MNTKRMIDNFVKYTKVDTAVKLNTEAVPSSPGQLELAKIVADDLRNAGAKDLEVTEEGFIFVTIPSNLPDSHKAKNKVPTIGYLAHLDTSDDAPGKGVKARFIENYKGGEITYPANPELKLNYENAPDLKNCVGHTIITSDGTTLLGGDDKAGLAVLVELIHHYKENPNDLHGKIRLAVIPDEEIGVGAHRLDIKQFGADVAYTLDGGVMGEIDIESFNGFKADLKVEGYSSFPGYGKGVYTSAMQIICNFVSRMTKTKWPQNAEGREPIWWIQSMSADVGKGEAMLLLRDFDLEGIKKQEAQLKAVRDELQKEFPKAKISVEVKEMYKNYKYELEKDPRVVEYAKEAMKKIGIEPRLNYVRGGNDSAALCFRGLLSTNLFIGMRNMHSINEWNTVETIEGAFKTVVSLSKVWVEKSA